MKQYYVAKNEELSPDRIAAIINDFLLDGQVKLNKRYNYYLGIQNILRKEATDEGKPCNKIVTNYVRNIVETYKGYTVGIPVSYSSDNEGFDALMDVLKYNDSNNEDGSLMKDALIYGRAFEIAYIDEGSKQRIKTLNPKGCIPVYANDLNADLLYVIRFWEEEIDVTKRNYYIEVYDNLEVTTYKSESGFTSMVYLDKKPHFHSQVPITVFSLNEEEEGIADQIFSLQDAYNSLLSDSIDDFDAFCDAYMVIKGMTADDEDISAMKQHRVLMLDTDASADYLTKDVSTQEIQNLLTTCESKIREISSCPNFSNETFATSSGIAIRYRMMAMENKVAGIMDYFKKALQKRIELLAEIIKLVNGEELWRDIEIEFHRNIPTDLSSVAQQINQFRGLVSDETLLSQIPFVTNVEEELKKIKEQDKAKADIYNNLIGAEDEQMEQ